MSAPLDLATASRDDLLTLIATLQESVRTLEERVHTLEAKVQPSVGKGVPGTKPASETRSKARGKPRKQRPHGFARRRALAPTAQVTHAAEHCPQCQTPLVGGWVKRRREVIDLTPARVQVTEHLFLARRCPSCAKEIVPAVDLGTEVSGQQRLGAGLVSLIVTLREVGRLPVRQLQWYLEAVHGLRLSVGAIIAASARVAAAGAQEVAAITTRIRGSPVVHADETGWRQDGHNGYAWTFTTPTSRLFVHGNRTKAMVDAVLDETAGGVLVTDFYAAYHHYPGRKQRCWTHLLRAIHELGQVYPDDVSLERWAAQVHALYVAAVAIAHRDLTTAQRQQAQEEAEARLQQLCAPYATDHSAAQRQLCQRALKHLQELFVFVREPDVPPDNNAAERSLRHLVTSRKISGGTRSAAGTKTKMTLATLFGTWRLANCDLLSAARQLLLSPQA